MRAMRLIVMFDLPTGNKAERKSYAEFHKFLLKDGYHMEQFSVYSHVLLSRDSAEARLKRLRNNLPRAGSVTVFELTEKQYEAREVLMETRALAALAPEDMGAQLTIAL